MTGILVAVVAALPMLAMGFNAGLIFWLCLEARGFSWRSGYAAGSAELKRQVDEAYHRGRADQARLGVVVLR